MTNRSRNDWEPLSSELYIRRLPVEEALFRLERYLDEVFVAGLTTVRVVHGKGTGTLKAAVRQVLAKHPLVKSYREGYIGEGDAGVTVVEMERRWS